MLLLTEPPANGNFMIAAYVIVAVVLCGYSLRLWRRAAAMDHDE